MTGPEHRLPPEFVEWLASLPPVHTVIYKKEDWEFTFFETLSEPVQIDKTTTTFAAQLTGFAATYRNMGETSADGPRRTKFGFDRLERSIVLAEQNEELLFVDPDDNFSLWKLEPEECTVRKVADDIFTFMQGAVVEDLSA